MGNHFRKAVLVATLLAASACSDVSPVWIYERTPDKLRDATNVIATIRSQEKYEDVRLKVVIERRADQADVGYIFHQYPSDRCDPNNPYLMRLDTGPIEPVPCLKPDLVAAPRNHIPASTIQRIEQADTLVVEAPTSAGPVQYTFRVRVRPRRPSTFPRQLPDAATGLAGRDFQFSKRLSRNSLARRAKRRLLRARRPFSPPKA